jgi:hypothetical protein
MKKSILILSSLVFFVSCKSWDPSMIKVEDAPLPTKLLALERQMGDVANTTIVSNKDELKLFTQEVEQNLTNPYGDKYGYIVFKTNFIEAKDGLGFLILSSATLSLLNIFGLPWQKVYRKIEVEIRVLDSKRRLIGKYSAVGEASTTIAYYYGYKSGDAYRKTHAEVIANALNKIRPKILADANRINNSLSDSGKL